MSNKSLPVLIAALVALLLLIIISISRVGPAVETDLTQRSVDVLRLNGFDTVTAQADGQNMTLLGTVSDEQARLNALELVRNVWGVERVDDGLQLQRKAVATTPPPATPKAELKPEPAEPVVTAAPAAAELNITPPAPPPQPARDNPLAISPYTFNLDYNGEMVLVSGFIPSEDLRSQLLENLDNRFGPYNVVDQAMIGDGAPKHFSAVVFETLLPRLDQFNQASLKVVDQSIVIEGEVQAQISAATLSSDILASLDEGLDARVDLRQPAAADQPPAPPTETVNTSQTEQPEAPDAPTTAASAITCQKQFNDLLGAQSIQFDSSRATIKAASFTLLDQLARIADSCKSYSFKIGGHTDATGSDQMNLELSRQRAVAVAEYLAARGVPASKMEAIGFGESMPIATNATIEGRQKNRRIEIIVKE